MDKHTFNQLCRDVRMLEEVKHSSFICASCKYRIRTKIKLLRGKIEEGLQLSGGVV